MATTSESIQPRVGPSRGPRIRQTLARGALVIVVAAGALLAGGSALATAPAATDTPESIGQRFVPAHPISAGGIVGAFNALSKSADALAFSTNGTPKPTDCKHIEGIARTNGPDGTPYLIYTKSGLDPGAFCIVPNEPGYLIVARMASRNHAGERFGTNILPFNKPDEWTNLEVDKAVTAIPLNGNNGMPSYRHPGGVQVLGNMLAVGTENPYHDETARATILFFDITDPENPTLTSRFNPLDPDTQNNDHNKEFGADPVGLTAVRAEDGACCRYLMVVAGGPANKDVRFFLSRPDAGKTTTTLSSTSLEWDLAGRYTEGALEACPGIGDWPEGSGPFNTGQHQMLQLRPRGEPRRPAVHDRRPPDGSHHQPVLGREAGSVRGSPRLAGRPGGVPPDARHLEDDERGVVGQLHVHGQLLRRLEHVRVAERRAPRRHLQSRRQRRAHLRRRVPDRQLRAG